VSGWYPGKYLDEYFGVGGHSPYYAQAYTSATDEMAALRQKHVDKWRSMGLTDNQINLALKLATDWVEGIEDFMTRAGATVNAQTTVGLYRTALEVADKWVNKMFTERLW